MILNNSNTRALTKRKTGEKCVNFSIQVQLSTYIGLLYLFFLFIFGYRKSCSTLITSFALVSLAIKSFRKRATLLVNVHSLNLINFSYAC